MKKLIIKDKKKVNSFNRCGKIHFVLSAISNNANFFYAIRRNANYKLKFLNPKSSVSTIANRCKLTVNKKRFNKLTRYSRHVFLKQIRHGKINGFQKASW